MSKLERIPCLLCCALALTATPAAAVQLDPLKWIKEQVSPTVQVPVQRPPESQIHIDGVAIAPPEGPACAEPLSARLEQAFLQAGITVVDRQKLDKVLNEFKLQASGAVDETTAAKIGQMLGAQALIFTQVSRCNTANSREESYREDKNGKIHYNYVTQATIAGSVRVIGLTSGRVLASQPFEAQAQLTDNDGYPDAFTALSEAEASASESVKKTLLPWIENVSLAFNKDKQCDLNQAYDLTKSGDFRQALEQSRANAENCAGKPAVMAKAHHNLGVMQMYFGEYDAALASFAEAEQFQPNKATKEATSKCKQAQQHSQALAAYNASAPAGAAKPVASAATAAPAKGKPAPSMKVPALGSAQVGSAQLGSAKLDTAAVTSTFPAKASQYQNEVSSSIKERLAELNDLCKSGLLTQDECAQRRSALLKKFDSR